MKNKLPTIKVQGGQSYIMVKDRVIYFNETYPDGCIQTEIVQNNESGVVFKATVYPDANNRNRFFTGYSESLTSAKGVEGQKPIEVCETSAIGRALAAMGIGVIESYASADEVAMAPQTGRQTRHDAPGGEKPVKTYNPKSLATDKQIDYIRSLITQKGLPMPDNEFFGTLTFLNAKKSIDKLLTKYPVKDQGDAPLNIEGDRSDYNSETGALEQ